MSHKCCVFKIMGNFDSTEFRVKLIKVQSNSVLNAWRCIYKMIKNKYPQMPDFPVRPAITMMAYSKFICDFINDWFDKISVSQGCHEEFKIYINISLVSARVDDIVEIYDTAPIPKNDSLPGIDYMDNKTRKEIEQSNIQVAGISEDLLSVGDDLL